MKKKLLLISLIGVFALTFATGCGCQKKEKEKDKEVAENNVILNQSEGVVKDQKLEQFTFENTSLVYETANSKSTLETIVTNTSSEDQTLDIFKIKFYDNNGELIVELPGFVGDVIKAGESRTIRSSCSEDLSKAKKIEYSVVRD